VLRSLVLVGRRPRPLLLKEVMEASNAPRPSEDGGAADAAGAGGGGGGGGAREAAPAGCGDAGGGCALARASDGDARVVGDAAVVGDAGDGSVAAEKCIQALSEASVRATITLHVPVGRTG